MNDEISRNILNRKDEIGLLKLIIIYLRILTIRSEFERMDYVRVESTLGVEEEVWVHVVNMLSRNYEHLFNI